MLNSPQSPIPQLCPVWSADFRALQTELTNLTAEAENQLQSILSQPTTAKEKSAALQPIAKKLMYLSQKAEVLDQEIFEQTYLEVDLSDNKKWKNKLAKILSPGKIIRELKLEHCSIDAEGAAFLARHPRLKKLCHLSLNNNAIGAAGAEAISRMINLTGLDLGENAIGAAGAEAISKMTNLTGLELSGNAIGAAGAVAISKMSNLTSLDLDFNEIGDAGAEAISKMTNLTSLELGFNNITPSVLAEIYQKLGIKK